MHIIHKIDGFLPNIFPRVDMNDKEALREALLKYYSYGSIKPEITFEDGFVSIFIDSNKVAANESTYSKVVAFCEQGNFTDAKPLLKKIIEKDPTNSDYHRIMGQILSEEGDQEEAINCLIDALKWNPKNGWALIMMGNIFAKYKEDNETAMKYYDQAVTINPDDVIGLNNIGGNFLQQDKIPEAKKYLERALAIDNNYPNTHYALSLIAEIENDFHSAFYSSVRAIKLNSKIDVLYQNSVRQAMKIATIISKTNDGKIAYSEFKNILQQENKTEIRIVKDDSIATSATAEIAENHDRDHHIIRYKNAGGAYEHLIMHELTHLDFLYKARKENLNQLFISNQENKKQFISRLNTSILKLKRAGFTELQISNYCDSLFDGINRQIFNTPIDLFIEDYLYTEYPSIRPYQFLSLLVMVKEGALAVTEKRILEIFPEEIISKSKIYNLVLALQFEDLYGINLVVEFKATPQQIKQATAFYNEYKEYKHDKEPAEEYELIEHWAEDLKLDKNFELVSETDFRNKRTNLDNLIESIEKDPFGADEQNPYADRLMKKFQESAKEMGTNMAVVMYMVDALKYFRGMPESDIKNIAIEIALQGTQGYRPESEYRLNAIPKKVFTGYQILAYYYVSFSIVLPDLLEELQLPYKEEYDLAIQFNVPPNE